jgi:hypothetical protein
MPRTAKTAIAALTVNMSSPDSPQRTIYRGSNLLAPAVGGFAAASGSVCFGIFRGNPE